ncbi:hypothetical protein CEXT_151111 [Caerostris extrusa]|uniref:Uncharacterized protein n=1 Tax=Caerostris extrusa TaxID=172846 RepID=A0AAV4TI55_CAEEX|nr:hypothetical protein CEXT_151111 [Caerostris extrusa]
MGCVDSGETKHSAMSACHQMNGGGCRNYLSEMKVMACSALWGGQGGVEEEDGDLFWSSVQWRRKEMIRFWRHTSTSLHPPVGCPVLVAQTCTGPASSTWRDWSDADWLRT